MRPRLSLRQNSTPTTSPTIEPTRCAATVAITVEARFSTKSPASISSIPARTTSSNLGTIAAGTQPATALVCQNAMNATSRTPVQPAGGRRLHQTRREPRPPASAVASGTAVMSVTLTRPFLQDVGSGHRFTLDGPPDPAEESVEPLGANDGGIPVWGKVDLDDVHDLGRPERHDPDFL